MGFDVSKLLTGVERDIVVRVDTAIGTYTLTSEDVEGPSSPLMRAAKGWLRPAVTVGTRDGQTLYRVAPYGDPPAPPNGWALLLLGVGALGAVVLTVHALTR